MNFPIGCILLSSASIRMRYWIWVCSRVHKMELWFVGAYRSALESFWRHFQMFRLCTFQNPTESLDWLIVLDRDWEWFCRCEYFIGKGAGCRKGGAGWLIKELSRQTRAIRRIGCAHPPDWSVSVIAGATGANLEAAVGIATGPLTTPYPMDVASVIPVNTQGALIDTDTHAGRSGPTHKPLGPV